MGEQMKTDLHWNA